MTLLVKHMSLADLISFDRGKEQQMMQNLFLYFSVAPDNVGVFNGALITTPWMKAM